MPPLRKLGTDFYSGAYAPAVDTDTSFDPYSPSRSGSDSDHADPHAITNLNPTATTSANFGPSSKDAYAPNLGIATRQPDIIRDVYGPQLADVGTKLESAYSAPRPGMLRQVLGAIVSRKNPALGGFISGEIQRQRSIEPLTQEYGILQNQIGAIRAQQNQEVKNRLDLSTAGKNEAETAAIPQKTAAEVARDAAATEASYYKDDPNLGLIDLRTRQPISSVGFAPLTKEEAAVVGKQEGDRVPLKVKNTANEIVNRGFATVNTEEGVYERNRGTGTMTRLGSNPRMLSAPSEQYTTALDPNDPSKQILVKKGQASSQGMQMPGSAEGVTAKATARAVAPGGKVGEEINAFNTAIQHADLLKKAAVALHNGDNQTLNGISNSLKNEFGIAGPVTAQAIADAYTRETTKMLSSGHMTDSEIGTVGKTLNPSKQSTDQILGVLNAYQALAQSKMKVRQQGVEQGLRGKAAFPTSTAAPASGGFNPF